MAARMKRVAACALRLATTAQAAAEPAFEPAPESWFSGNAVLSSAWADFDNDGDLDVVVAFAGTGLGLYRNDGTRFTRVEIGVQLAAEEVEARSLAWGDFDGDGDVDLYVATARTGGSLFLPGQANARSLLFRNDGAGGFSEVAQTLGVSFPGPNSRQANWIDFDNDGDLDLFVSQRSSENTLYRNDGSRFTDVSYDVRLDDPRRTVGSCWFDFDRDGDLDLFLANQQGDTDALHRNDNGVFTDVARELGVNQPQRTLDEGGVTCCGQRLRQRRRSRSVRRHLRRQSPVHERWKRAIRADRGAGRGRGQALGGRRELRGLRQRRLAGSLRRGVLVRCERREQLRCPVSQSGRNASRMCWRRRVPCAPPITACNGSTSIATATWICRWASRTPRRRAITCSSISSRSAQRRQSLQVSVLDGKGHATRAGAEVRIYDAKDTLLGTRLVSTGDGYGSQSVTPVHFGLPSLSPVTVEVTFLTREGRKVLRRPNVKPRDWIGKAVKISDSP